MTDVAISRRGLRVLKACFGLLLLFLYAPILIMAVFSFNDSITVTFPLSGFTLRWYREFLSNGELMVALRASAIVAATSSAIAVALGISAAVALVRKRFFGKGAVSGLLLAPLVIPYLILGISLLILFNAAAIPLSILTIATGHVVISVPYTVLVLVPRLERVSVSLEEAARDLGASGPRTFRSVTFPLILPAVISAFLVAFTLSFDEVVVASFLAGDQVTFPVYLYSQLRFPTRLPQVIALAVAVMAVSGFVVIGAEIGRRIADRRLATQLASAGTPETRGIP
ncbi:MAG: ABC transporter permease [Actinomycetota bacterium]